MTVTSGSGEERDLWRAIARGLKGRCPHCGQGRIFGRFLKVNDHCDACGEALHHHRADDLPAYLSIVVVGHVVIFLMVELAMHTTLPPLTHLMILLPLALALALGLIQPLKGMVIGLQWANRMHGFDPTTRDPALPDEGA